MEKKKIFRRTILSLAATTFLAMQSLTVFAGTYDVMDYDGTVSKIEEPATDRIIENIRKKNGDKAVDLYIKAMASGDYKEFYEYVGSTTETLNVEEYMAVGEGEEPINRNNKAQQRETTMQTIVGPTGTVSMVGDAAREKGYEPDDNGILKYYLDIILGESQRPDYAKDPVYRIAELNLHPRTIEEMELYNDAGIVIEYPDEPLTDFQKMIIDMYDLKIEPASKYNLEKIAKENEKETQEAMARANAKKDAGSTGTDTTGTNQKTQSTGLTGYQFLLIAIIVVVVSFVSTLITVSVMKKKYRK